MNELLDINGWFGLLRWTHFLAGITWIGLLYYFNFVQVPFLAKASNETKKDVTLNLLPSALWWFRWAAMVTFVAGLIMLCINHTIFGGIYWSSSRGIYILIGSILGSLMWFNVWFVIWPNQKLIIASVANKNSQDVSKNRRTAFLASRLNTLYSIPMLFFMGASPHGPWVFYQGSLTGVYSILVIGVVVGLLTFVRFLRG